MKDNPTTRRPPAGLGIDDPDPLGSGATLASPEALAGPTYAHKRGRSALERDLSMFFRHHKQTRKSVSRIDVTSQHEGARGCLMAVRDGAREEICTPAV